MGEEKVSIGKIVKWVVILGVAAMAWFVPKHPPVFVGYRQGILSDGVLIVRNTSDKIIKGEIVLFKAGGGEGRMFPVCFDPGESKEFGALQVDDYAPSVGSHGYVRFDGYILAERFEMVDKKTFSQHAVPYFMAEIDEVTKK